MSYGLSVGPHVFELTDDDKSHGALRSSVLLAVREKLRFTFVLSQLWDGSSFGLAPTLTHTYLPSGSFAGVDASGQTLSATLQLLVGY